MGVKKVLNSVGTPECKLKFLVGYQETLLALSNAIIFSSVAICEGG